MAVTGVAGDPTPRSPAEVMADRAYKVEHIEQLAHDVVKLVVFHRGTETFWQTFYKALDDQKATSWFEVVPHKRMIVEYRTKS